MLSARIRRSINYLKAEPNLFLDAIVINTLRWLPDSLYLKLRFRFNIGYWPNFKNPKSFNEKLNWLKLYDRKTVYTTMVDKHAVKQYVAKLIGDEYIIPTICTWDKVEFIDWDKLPNKFVLKTNHGGGGNCGVVICKDKSRFDKAEAIKNLSTSLAGSIYSYYREWPYKNVPKKIIAEELLEHNEEDIKDYKFFCFSGVVRFFKVDFNRFVEHHANYYDRDGHIMKFGEEACPPVFDHFEALPTNLGDMIKIAETISYGHRFLRVDLYNVEGRIYFGETTFYPASGFGKFVPADYDFKIGDLLQL